MTREEIKAIEEKEAGDKGKIEKVSRKINRTEKNIRGTSREEEDFVGKYIIGILTGLLIFGSTKWQKPDK